MVGFTLMAGLQFSAMSSYAISVKVTIFSDSFSLDVVTTLVTGLNFVKVYVLFIDVLGLNDGGYVFETHSLYFSTVTYVQYY